MKDNHASDFPWEGALAKSDVPVLVQTLAKADAKAVSFDQSLELCRTFEFLNRANFGKVKAGTAQLQAEFFWRHFHQLLILGVRTGSSAARSLFSGMAWAISVSNPLTLALTLRSLIEHAAVLESIRDPLARQVHRLRDEVWPGFASGSPPVPTQDDRTIHAELYLLAFGRGNILDLAGMPKNDAPDPEWEQYYRTKRDDRNMIPPEESARQIGKYLGLTKSKDGCHQLSAIYSYLSEYCHANGSSRAFDFWVKERPTGTFGVRRELKDRQGPGHHAVKQCALKTVPAACDLIVDSLSAMSKAMMPITENKYPLTNTPPPAGWTVFVDQHGRDGAVDDSGISQFEPDRAIELTAAQTARVTKIWNVFRIACGDSLEGWLNSFRMDTVWCDDELRMWEHLARVYTREVAERPGINQWERVMLFGDLAGIPSAESVGELLSRGPHLKGLPKLDRVFSRVKEGT